ncbi:hypothetical protein B0T20DRAFT_63074 [Sordaria brevicollis]|uniref:Uncharacterized protein n=1 Tax=Sordaria brevicollis TaxID=83679 RepID=A0AAE0P1S0_SORBR|nr:hypothetical protein B0T20DRAFT_63074 [Sordaria brevicollis]
MCRRVDLRRWRLVERPETGNWLATGSHPAFRDRALPAKSRECVPYSRFGRQNHVVCMVVPRRLAKDLGLHSNGTQLHQDDWAISTTYCTYPNWQMDADFSFSTTSVGKFAFRKMTPRQLTRSFFPSLGEDGTKPFRELNRASIRIPNFEYTHCIADIGWQTHSAPTPKFIAFGFPSLHQRRLRHPIFSHSFKISHHKIWSIHCHR